MRFTQAEIDQAVQEFTAQAKSRVVPAFGYNKDITVYGEHDGSIQATVGSDNADVDRGDEPA